MKSPKTNSEGWELLMRHISRPELARRLGLSKQAIHRWGQLPLEHVVKVEQITNIPREWLLPEHVHFFKPSNPKIKEHLLEKTQN